MHCHALCTCVCVCADAALAPHALHRRRPRRSARELPGLFTSVLGSPPPPDLLSHPFKASVGLNRSLRKAQHRLQAAVDT